jgi:hypothetical protein
MNVISALLVIAVCSPAANEAGEGVVKGMLEAA